MKAKSPGYIEAEQFEMRAIGQVLNGYSLAEVRIMREGLSETLAKEGRGIAAAVETLCTSTPGLEARAFGDLLALLPRGLRAKARTLRCVCSYIHALERKAAPHASATPPPKRQLQHHG